jgi:TRAP-type mannitol/chloroaromatic compound transport system substrate-binding protein
VYESFMAFRTKSIAWAKIATQAYLNARTLPFKY